jgi:hypothetical protein
MYTRKKGRKKEKEGEKSMEGYKQINNQQE